ncbi:hypothetical protein NXW31_17875 [Bacteroides fragilis]|nr:hypothetical protein [Bacteroides fragilis]
MKLNNIKTVLLLVGVLMTFGSMKAQDNPFKPEWFVSGGINGLSALNGSASNMLGGKVSGGVWLNKIIGLRVNAEAGNVWLKGGYNAVTAGAGADIMVSLMKNYADEDSKFRLNAIFGLGYNYYSFDNDFPNLSKTNTISGNFSLQVRLQTERKTKCLCRTGN